MKPLLINASLALCWSLWTIDLQAEVHPEAQFFLDSQCTGEPLTASDLEQATPPIPGIKQIGRVTRHYRVKGCFVDHGVVTSHCTEWVYGEPDEQDPLLLAWIRNRPTLFYSARYGDGRPVTTDCKLGVDSWSSAPCLLNRNLETDEAAWGDPEPPNHNGPCHKERSGEGALEPNAISADRRGAGALFTSGCLWTRLRHYYCYEDKKENTFEALEERVYTSDIQL